MSGSLVLLKTYKIVMASKAQEVAVRRGCFAKAGDGQINEIQGDSGQKRVVHPVPVSVSRYS